MSDTVLPCRTVFLAKPRCVHPAQHRASAAATQSVRPARKGHETMGRGMRIEIDNRIYNSGNLNKPYR
jgi:hypothetical protein